MEKEPIKAKVINNWTTETVLNYSGYSQYAIINYFVTRYSPNFTLEVEGIKCKISYYLACLYLHLYRTYVDNKKSMIRKYGGSNR